MIDFADDANDTQTKEGLLLPQNKDIHVKWYRLGHTMLEKFGIKNVLARKLEF